MTKWIAVRIFEKQATFSIGGEGAIPIKFPFFTELSSFMQ